MWLTHKNSDGIAQSVTILLFECFFMCTEDDHCQGARHLQLFVKLVIKEETTQVPNGIYFFFDCSCTCIMYSCCYDFFLFDLNIFFI